MIAIDRIRLKLPAGYQHRATSIALLVGDLLAEQSVYENIEVEKLRLDMQPFNVHTPDIEIAKMIVGQIIARLTGA